MLYFYILRYRILSFHNWIIKRRHWKKIVSTILTHKCVIFKTFVAFGAKLIFLIFYRTKMKIFILCGFLALICLKKILWRNCNEEACNDNNSLNFKRANEQACNKSEGIPSEQCTKGTTTNVALESTTISSVKSRTSISEKSTTKSDVESSTKNSMELTTKSTAESTTMTSEESTTKSGE